MRRHVLPTEPSPTTTNLTAIGYSDIINIWLNTLASLKYLTLVACLISRYKFYWIKIMCGFFWTVTIVHDLASFSLQFFFSIHLLQLIARSPHAANLAATLFFSLLLKQFHPKSFAVQLCFFKTNLSFVSIAQVHTTSLFFRLKVYLASVYVVHLIFKICAISPFFHGHRIPDREDWLLPFIFFPSPTVVSFLFWVFQFQLIGLALFNKQLILGFFLWHRLKFFLLLLFPSISSIFHTKLTVFLSERFFKSLPCHFLFPF